MAPQTLPETRQPDNPWIVRNGVPVGISAGHIERRLNDLKAWTEETGQKLPLPAPYIIGLELRGFVVDLETGAHSLPPRYTPTAAGVAAARPWTPREEGNSGG